MGRFKLVTVTKGFHKVRRCSKIWKTDLLPYFTLTFSPTSVAVQSIDSGKKVPDISC